MQGAFSIPRKTLSLRPTDQSCHHETWLHLDFVDWRSTPSHHEEPDRRILLEERPTACPYGQQKKAYRVTIRTRLSIICETCTSSRSDLLTFRVRIQ